MKEEHKRKDQTGKQWKHRKKEKRVTTNLLLFLFYMCYLLFLFLFVVLYLFRWGLTNGVASALIFRDLILGQQNEWADIVDARRWDLIKSTPGMIKEAVTTNKKNKTKQEKIDERANNKKQCFASVT